MADDLDPDEQELLRKHREKKAATRKAEDADKRAWLRNADGSEADVPYDKARGWLQKTFGIDLDAEEVQDEPDEPDAPKAKPGSKQGGQVRAFGRRVS